MTRAANIMSFDRDGQHLTTATPRTRAEWSSAWRAARTGSATIFLYSATLRDDGSLYGLSALPTLVRAMYG